MTKPLPRAVDSNNVKLVNYCHLLEVIRGDPFLAEGEPLRGESMKLYERLLARFWREAPTSRNGKVDIDTERHRLFKFFERLFARVPVKQADATADRRKLARLEAKRIEEFVLEGRDEFTFKETRAGVGNRESTSRARARARKRRRSKRESSSRH